jgi:hypothetical protein
VVPDLKCDACGAPKITITTRKGPWTICIDPQCPEKVAAGTSLSKSSARGTKKRTTARKRPSKN